MLLRAEDIKKNDIANKINQIPDKRLKGNLRQVEILKFLTIWKFTTKKQLAYITGTREENLYKHLNRLTKLGLIKIHKHYGKSIIEITKRGLELIANYANIDYEFFKTKEKWKKENIEHDLIIRDYAIRYYNSFIYQYTVKTSLYFREIYKLISNKNYAQKLIRSLHKADFIIIDRIEEKIIGVEYEHTHKNLKDVRKKVASMIDSVGYYSNYLILAKDENILDSFRRKVYKSINVSSNSDMKFIYITNLDEDNEFKYSAMLEDIAKDAMKNLIEKIEKMNSIYYISELTKKTS